jgi:protocatechuate 3,4-dioxygenase, alpha subunit
MALRQTPSQTLGPFFAYGLTPEQYGYEFASIAHPSMVDDDTRGEPIRVVGRVFDGAGAPVTDAMIEIWQADDQGRYAHPADSRGSNATFKGFGRCGTGSDARGRFSFTTIRPGRIGDGQAPHLNVIVLMRGLLSHCFTRIFFEDEAEANAADPVLNSVPLERRTTLIAKRETAPAGSIYRFDIHMQGDLETVFFDV